MAKLNYNLIICLLVVICSGCDKIELGEPFDCRIETQYRIKNGLSFTIDSLRDYRCPKDMLCFWSGDVAIYVSINNYMRVIDTTIYLVSRHANPIEIGGFTWRIMEVNPWLNAGQTAYQDEYIIKLLINK